MKKILLLPLMIIFFLITQAQMPAGDSTTKKQKHKTSALGIGIKAGLNFANVTNASSVNSKSQTGFHAGLFYATPYTSIIGSHTELLYSTQGYHFSSDTSSGSTKLNYIMLAQLVAINITRFVQIQLGAQFGYLLNAKADSTRQSTGNATADRILSLYNRYDYGFAGGIEIHPVAGLLIGARYNISFSDLYKQSASASTYPGINFKNNVVQLFAGYRF